MLLLLLLLLLLNNFLGLSPLFYPFILSSLMMLQKSILPSKRIYTGMCAYSMYEHVYIIQLVKLAPQIPYSLSSREGLKLALQLLQGYEAKRREAS